MPSSSSFLTKLASEYLGGGSVKCCSSIILSILTVSLSFTSGKILSSSSFLSISWYNFKKPSNFKTDPEALNLIVSSFDDKIIVFLSYSALCIWDERALFHIKSYNLNWSEFTYFLISDGVLIISVGLIASWASCAFLAFLPL